MSESRTSLSKLFSSQSVEAARNRLRADRADREGRAHQARLFHALASGQQVHADKALLLLCDPDETATTDIDAAAAAIALTVDELAPLIMTAATEREPVLETTFLQFTKAAKSHAAMLTHRADTAGPYHVCQICGYIATETAPDRCPVCRAVTEQFRAVE